jgi:nucleotidyltransferase/DNA polymerase involved in DNA repair
MNINKAVDKAYEKKTLKEMANAPVDALEGIGPAGAEALNKFFQVKTVKDLANLKYVKWAQAIVDLAESEE